GFTKDEFEAKRKAVKLKLKSTRAKRTRPGLDDKVISGWNGLVISGLCQAYHATDNPKFLELALRNGEFLSAKMMKDGQLYRSYNIGLAYTPSFLEDYAAVVQAFIYLYQTQFDRKWLNGAKILTDYALDHFFDDQDGFFYFNNPYAEKLIANKKELFDNVIPSSNSMMARNLHQLGSYFYDNHYSEISQNMLGHIKSMLSQDIGFLANWANLYLEQMVPTAEVAVVGENAKDIAFQFKRNYYPN